MKKIPLQSNIFAISIAITNVRKYKLRYENCPPQYKIGLSQSLNQEKLWIKFAKWNDLKRIPRHFQKEKKVLKSMDSEKIYVE